MSFETIDEIMKLCDMVRQTGFELRSYLGNGHLEKVYEIGLAHRLRKQGLQVSSKFQSPFMMRTGPFLATILPICSSEAF